MKTKKNTKFHEFGKTLREFREKADLTQGELANHINVNVQFISNMERGICMIPPEYVKKAATILKIDPLLLIDEMVRELCDGLMKRAGL